MLRCDKYWGGYCTEARESIALCPRALLLLLLQLLLLLLLPLLPLPSKSPEVRLQLEPRE